MGLWKQIYQSWMSYRQLPSIASELHGNCLCTFNDHEGWGMSRSASLQVLDHGY